MQSNRLVMIVLGVVLLLGAVLVLEWIFTTWFGTHYYAWYRSNGALFGIATTLTALVWGNARKHTGLIAAHPWTYLGSHLQLVGLPLYVLGTHLRRDPAGTARRPNPLDGLLTLAFMLALVLVLLVWFVVVVPLQYFVFLLCGAPARVFGKSRRQVIAQLQGSQLKFQETDEVEAVPEGWWNASLADKPVAVTGLFTALFFLLIKIVSAWF